MDKKNQRSKKQDEGPKPCRKSTASKDTSGAAKHKSPFHSGMKFIANPKKTTVVKPFSFDRMKKEEVTPCCSAEKKVEKVPEPRDAEGKVHVVMDTLKISSSEECNSVESSSSKMKSSKSPIDDTECAKKGHDECSRPTKRLMNLLVEKPTRAKSPTKENTASAKKESEIVIKKECTRCKRSAPDLLKTPKPEVKPSKDKSHLKESSKSSVKECTRESRNGKLQVELQKGQKTEVKIRANSPETGKVDEPKLQARKIIKTKPGCSKIAKYQQVTKSEVKTSQAKNTIEVEVAAVDSTVTRVEENTYVSKESVVMSSQTSNGESFCIIEEAISGSGIEVKSLSDLNSSVMAAIEEKQVLNGSEPKIFYVTEDECNSMNEKNTVSELLEETKYEAESFMETKTVQEIQQSTSKIPRKTQGTTPNVKMNGSLVKQAIAEQFNENRCPNLMNQLANHEESLLVN